MSMYNLADKKVTGDTLLTRAKEYINNFYKDHGRNGEISARWVLSYYIIMGVTVSPRDLELSFGPPQSESP